MIPAAPPSAVAGSQAPELPQAPPTPAPAVAGSVGRPSQGASDRATAPQRGGVPQPFAGSGTASTASPGALSAQRSGERKALAPSAEGTRSAAATPGAPATGAETAGPPAVASGTPSGTDTRSTAPTGSGQTTAGGSTPGDVQSDTGSGSGGQAVAQGGAPGANPERGAGGGRGPGNVAITTPQNGYTLSPDEPPIVIVRGQVDDPEVSTIWLAANKRRVQVRVRDGKFQYPLVVVDPTTTISAELPASSSRRSEAITVHAAPNSVTTGVILLDWGEAKPTGGVEMTAKWRARSDRLDGPETKLFVRMATLPDDIPVSAFYLRNMQAGVYTFILGYRALGAGTPFAPRFYLTSPGIPTARDMKPVTLAGSGKTPAVRFLLPQGVLWEQDDWFTGRSEASDTITKFRDDGTTWIERKGEVR